MNFARTILPAQQAEPIVAEDIVITDRFPLKATGTKPQEQPELSPTLPLQMRPVPLSPCLSIKPNRGIFHPICRK